jgi:hypothetical protein
MLVHFSVNSVEDKEVQLRTNLMQHIIWNGENTRRCVWRNSLENVEEQSDHDCKVEHCILYNKIELHIKPQGAPPEI